MEDEIENFLKINCKLKDTAYSEIYDKLQQSGCTELLTLIEGDQEIFKDLGFTKIQINSLSQGLQDLLQKSEIVQPTQIIKNEEQIQIKENNSQRYKQLKIENPQKEQNKFEEQAVQIDTSTTLKVEMTQKEQKDKFILFQSYEDASSEYKMSKIRLNQAEFMDFFKDIKEKQIQVIGFYGCFKTSLRMTEIYLQKPIQFQDDSEEGLYAFKNNIKVSIILKTNEDLYKYQNGTDSNHLVTIYLRYLVDVCENIFAVFPESTDFNPDLGNPYETYINPGFSLQEKIVEPSLNVEVKEIPVLLQQGLQEDLSEYQSSLDFNKFLSKCKITKEVDQQGLK